MSILDTNICAFFISRRDPAVTAGFREVEPHEVTFSALVAAELADGVEHSTRVEQNRRALESFMRLIIGVPWDASVMWHFAQHKTPPTRLGQPIGESNLLIGCQALALDAVLVTNNTRGFERIDGLKLENWAA
ncbi:MAG: type II toxin-antitoxin system VapC family toxin [Tepidimonas sp.]